MARPKEQSGSLSAAFRDKCLKERQKLQQKLAKQLKEDMEGLLVEDGGNTADLRVVLQDGELSLHSSLLQARSLALYTDLLALPGPASVKLDNIMLSDMMQVAREIYTKDDLNVSNDLIQQWITENKNSDSVSGINKLNTKTGSISEKTDFISTSTQPNCWAEKVIGIEQEGYHLAADCDRNIPAQDGILSSLPDPESQMIDLCEKADIEILRDDSVSSDIPSDSMASSSLELMGTSVESQSSVDPMSTSAELHTSPSKESCQRKTASNSTNIFTEPGDEGKGNKEESPGGLGNQQAEAASRLGTDLLNLFNSGMGADVTILVQQREFRAHKFILCTRSPFFSAMLGGAWRESSANQISLEGVTAPAVEQALLFMYGGVCDLQPTCNLLELLTVADMYGIEALKDVVSYVLKMECCHFFHKPCSGCIIGVTDTLPLVETFALHEVGDKCYKWVTRHFVRMWANKGFAALPEAILNKCCDSAIQDIVTDNVIEMVIECDRLMGMIPRVRWSEPVFAMATKLMEACIEHLRNNFTDVIGTQKFLALGKSMAWGMSFMEDVFGRAIMTMPTDKGCKTYAAFQKLKDWAVCEDCEWTEDFQNMIIALLEKCETYMMLYINQLYETSDWLLLSPEMQAKMKEGGWYVAVGDSKKRAPKPQLTSSKPKSARPASSDAALYSASCMGQRPRDLTLNKDATAKPKQPTPSPGVKAGMTKQKNRPISAPAAVSGASSRSVVPSVAASATKVTQKTKRATASGKLPPSGDMRKKVPQKSASAGGATSGHDAVSRKEQQPKVTKSSKNQHIKQTSKNGQPTRPSSLAGSAQRSRPSSGGSSSVKDKENTHMHGKSGARCDVPMPRKKSVTKEKEKVKTGIPKMQETKPQPHRKPVLGLQTLNSHTVNTGAKSDSLNLKGRKNQAGIKSSASLRGHNSGLKYPTPLSSNCKDISPRKDHPASHMDNKDTFFENDNLFHKDSILSPGCFEAEKEATKALDLLCVALDEDSTDDEEKKVHGIHSASTAECESGSSVDGWDLAWPMYEEVSLIPLLGVRFVPGIRDPF